MADPIVSLQRGLCYIHYLCFATYIMYASRDKAILLCPSLSPLHRTKVFQLLNPITPPSSTHSASSAEKQVPKSSIIHPFFAQPQLEELEEEAQQLGSVSIPPQWRETERKQLRCDFALRETLWSLVHTSFGPSTPPHAPSFSENRGKRVKEILTCVWAPGTLETLFMPRQQLELIGLMKRTASSTTAALKQVLEC